MTLREKMLLGVLGQRIKRARESKGWSQQELARRTGVDRGFLARIERGKQNVGILKLDAVTRAFGYDLGHFTYCLYSPPRPQRSWPWAPRDDAHFRKELLKALKAASSIS